MSKSKKFTVAMDKFKTAVSKKLDIQYDNIEIDYGETEDMVIKVKRGILDEEIKLTDNIVYEILEIDKNEIELDYMVYSESYSYRVDEDDSNIIINIYTKDPSDLKEVA